MQIAYKLCKKYLNYYLCILYKMNYICELCNYTTNRKSSYKNHCNAKKHTEKVDLYNKKLELENNLITLNEHKNHVICEFCKAKFFNNSSLKRHMKTCSVVLKKNSFLEFENKNLKTKVSELGTLVEYYQDLLATNTDTLNKSVSNVNFANKFLSDALTLMKPSKEKMELLVDHHTYRNLSKFKNKKTLLFIKNQRTDYDWKLYDIMTYEYGKGNSKKTGDVNREKCRIFLAKYLAEKVYEMYKTENPENQSIWATDIARLNYIIKKAISKTKKSKWFNDTKGKTLRQIVVRPILEDIKKIIKKEVNEDMKFFTDPEFNGHTREIKMRMTQRGSYIINDIDDKKLEELVIKEMAKHFKLDQKLLKDLELKSE